MTGEHMTDKNFLHSSYREKLIEHLFIGELMRLDWCANKCELELALPEVDAGSDLIAECGGIIRHIQLKAARIGGSTPKQKINTSLEAKPSGCVIWIMFDDDTMRLGPFYWFGNAPGEPLPDLSDFKVAKHTKANSEGVKAERERIKVIPKGRFTMVETMEEIYGLLFGRC
jgi:hypothetical protein